MSLHCSMCSSTFDDAISYEVHCLYAHISNDSSNYSSANSSISPTSFGDSSYVDTFDTNFQSTTNSLPNFHHFAVSDPAKMYDLASQSRIYQPQPTYSEAYNLQNTKGDGNFPINSGSSTSYTGERRNEHPASENTDISKCELYSSDLSRMPTFEPNSSHAFRPPTQSMNPSPKKETSQKTNDCCPEERQQQHSTNSDKGGTVTSNKCEVSDTSSSYSSLSGVSNASISFSDSHSDEKSSSKVGKNLNNVRRPKTYYCPACERWFTSSGHLKRHYETMVHKNALKQSGLPDPAMLPAREYYYPDRDPAYSSNHQQVEASLSSFDCANNIPDYTTGSVGTQKVTETVNPYSISPFQKSMVGPMQVPGGHLHHSLCGQSQSSDFESSTPIAVQQHQSYPNSQNYSQGFSTLTMPPSHVSQFFQRPAETAFYPNSQASYTSTNIHHCASNPTFCDLAMKMVPNSTCGRSVGVNYRQLPCCESNHCGKEPFYVSSLGYGAAERPAFVSFDGKIDKSTDMIRQEPIRGYFSQLLTTQSSSFKPPLLEDTNVTSSTSRSSRTNVFYCKECDKNFTQERYLTRHNKMYHCASKAFKCPVCSKCFKDQEQYKQHAKKHFEGDSYECGQCSETFDDKMELKKHSCLRKKSRLYTCDVCGKGFIRKDDMAKHCTRHQKRRRSLRLKNIVKQKKISPWSEL